MRATIYFLSGPNKSDIFYVGKTIGSLKQRLNAHKKCKSNTGRVEKMIEYGDLVEIHKIEVVNGDTWLIAKREAKWIRKYISTGHQMTNVSRRVNKGGPSGSVKVDVDIYREAAGYCDQQGWKIAAYVTKAVREKLERDRAAEVSG